MLNHLEFQSGIPLIFKRELVSHWLPLKNCRKNGFGIHSHSVSQLLYATTVALNKNDKMEKAFSAATRT